MSFGSKDQASRFQIRLVRGSLMLAVVQFLAMAFLGPYLLSKHNLIEAGMIYNLGALISSSHLPRYFFFDFPMAIDARSFGLLCGAFLGLASYNQLSSLYTFLINRIPGSFVKPTFWAISGLIALPFIVTLFAHGASQYSLNTLFLFGLLPGFTCPFCLVPIASSAVAFVWSQFARFFATARPVRS